MFKNIFLTFIIALIVGCSAPSPQNSPSWYITPPKDDTKFYGVGDAQSEDTAKEKAVLSLRNNISEELDSAFENKGHKLSHVHEDTFAKILKFNNYLSGVLSIKDAKTEESATFKNSKHVLISIPKTSILHQINNLTEKQLSIIQKDYNTFNEINNENDDPVIAVKKYKIFTQTMKKFPIAASLIQLKKCCLPSYNIKNSFDLLYEVEKDYTELKSDITFYVLSDVNSLVYVNPIIRAVELEGFVNNRTAHGKYPLKLLLTSETENIQDYSFNKSKTLVKCTTYDADKNQLAFKQHTYVGMSRKDYQDAKKHSAEYLGAEVKKFGLFGFIGMEEKLLRN